MKYYASTLIVFACLLTLTSGCASDSNGDSVLPFSTRRPVDAVKDLFNVYDADIRRRAVTDLSNAPFGGEEEYVKSYRLLSDDPDPTVKAVAIRALGRHGALKDVPGVFIPNLTSKETVVRWESARALQRFHHQDAMLPLIKLVREDEDSDVRTAGVFALAQYPHSRVYQTMVGLLNDDDYAVVAQSVKTLHRLTGESFGDDGRRWLAWSANRQNLFTAGLTYYYKDYSRPPTFTEKLKFWKKKEVVSPQKPVSLTDAGTQSPGND